jgi:YidC/Oxa1 family membrane protein insertase
MDTQRLILFVVFSFSLLLLWDSWQKDHQPKPAAEHVQKANTTAQVPTSATPAGQAKAQVETSAVLQAGQSIHVQTDMVDADISTVGGDLRRLVLLKHRDTLDNKKNFTLLEDDPARIYVAQSGFINGGPLPTHKALFQTDATQYELKPGQDSVTVKLTWQQDGLQVVKRYTFHRGSYVIDVAYDVTNNGTATLAPDAYFQLLRNGHPPAGDPKFVHTYTGAAVYTDATKFHKIGFPDIEKGKEQLPPKSNDGWIAMLQHYFLSAWLPENKTPREFYTRRVGNDLYSAGVIVPVGTIAPGSTRSVSMRLYAGPQEQKNLSALAPGLDLSVDYGWLTVIATPIFWVLSAIHGVVGNWGVAIILLTVLIKLAFFPLSAKSYRSMAQMRVLSPKLQKLKEQYGDDRQKLHQAMMELYKTEKINPLGGCLPVVVQIPVFISLYWVLLATVELRQAPFALWIHDLASPDPYYVLPIIMGITMILQTKLNPTPPDPIQAKVMMIMPIAFSIFFFFFPAGLVLYWLVNNVLSITQQWYITRGIEAAKAGHASR